MDSSRHTPHYFASLKNGEEEGFDYFFRLYYPSLLHYATNLLHSQEEAQDAVQDAFATLWAKHATLRHPTALKTFLYRVVHNNCINFLRAQQKATRNQPNIIALQPTEEEQTALQQELIRAEFLQHVYGAIDALPPQARTVFRLFYFQGKNYAEIAEELQLSISTIRNQKARALRLIKGQLFLIMLLAVFGS